MDRFDQRNAFLVYIVGKRPRRGLGSVSCMGPVAGAVDKQQGGARPAVSNDPAIAADALTGISVSDGADLGREGGSRPRSEETGHHRGTDTRARIDRVPVGDARDGSESVPGAAGRRKAIDHAARHIDHAWSLVEREQLDTRSVGIGEFVDGNKALVSVLQKVRRELVATSAIRASTPSATPMRRATPAAERRAPATSLGSRTKLTIDISQFPTRQRDSRPFAGRGFDREFVR